MYLLSAWWVLTLTLSMSSTLYRRRHLNRQSGRSQSIGGCVNTERWKDFSKRCPQGVYRYFSTKPQMTEQATAAGWSYTMETIAGYVLPRPVAGTVQMKVLDSKHRRSIAFSPPMCTKRTMPTAKLGYQYYPWGSKWYVASTRLPGTVPAVPFGQGDSFLHDQHRCQVGSTVSGR